jgi:hypothetical protein
MNNKVVTIILIILLLASIPIYWLRLAFNIPPIRDGLYLSTVFIALIGAFFAISKYGLKSARRVTLISFAVALLGSFTSELIFEYHFIILKHDIPFPSIGDFFSLLAYIGFFAALINEMRLAKVNWKHVNKLLLAGVILFSLTLICVVSYFGIYQAYDPAENLFTNLVSMGYGVGDLFLIIVSLFLVILVKEYRGGRFAKIWMTLLIGFVFFLASDITWSFYPTQYHDEVWFYKSLLDTLWMIGYLCFAWTFFQFGFSISDAYKMVDTEVGKNSKPISLKDSSISEEPPKEQQPQ